MKKKYLKMLQDRKAKMDRIDAMLALCETEKREFTPDVEQKEYDKLMLEIRELDPKIESLKKDIETRDIQQKLDEEAAGITAEIRPRTIVPGDMSVQGVMSAQELRDLQKYSFVRAFNARLEDRKLDGLEHEMSKEGEMELRAANAPRGAGNLFIPQKVLAYAGVVGSFEQRDLTATGGTAGDQGGVTVATNLGSLIDRLRKKLVMQQMGVTMMGGLVGNVDIPKVIADDQALEKAENATSAESSATFGKISLTPRRLPVFAEISRQLLLQTSSDVEAWVRNDLAFQIAQVMDSRAISGSGTAQPFGILNAAGVAAVALGVNGAVPTWDMAVDLESAVAALDADLGSMGYITNTKVRGKLKKTLMTASTASQFVWDRQSPATPLNEMRVGVTNLVPSNLTKGSGTSLSAILYGNFADSLMGQWGGLEFLVNPYSKDTEGLIRLNAWTFYDFILRRVESFAVCKDIITT